MERPTLRQLEALDMIVREGSFRAAARALGVSQVAVSDHVKQLEARLGASLFDRAKGGKASLSQAGEAALARARMILADCDALVATMRAFAGVASSTPAPASASAREAPPAPPLAKPAPAPAKAVARNRATVAKPSAPEDAPLVLSPPDPAPPEPEAAPDPEQEQEQEAPPLPGHADQPITIGVHPSILTRFQDKLAAFEDAFPARPVSVDFNCFVADRVALALSSNSISIGYFYALGATRVFPSDYLWSERWALYVGRDHRLAGREFVSREELATEALIGLSATNRLRPLVDACLAEAGLGALPYVLESDDYGQLVERAREGAGILPLFGAAAARIGASPGLKRLPYVDPIPAVEVRRVVHPSLVEDDEVQALVATLQ